MHVTPRPGLDKFLEQIAEHFEIAVFTAGTEEYANAVLDVIDKKGVIGRRLYRDSCTEVHEGEYAKDLSKHFGDLRRVIIVDNSSLAISLQPENAIHCLDFRSDPNDRELEHIGEFIVSMKDAEDVRDKLGQWVNWGKTTSNRTKPVGILCS